jgi:hypothetical protein
LRDGQEQEAKPDPVTAAGRRNTRVRNMLVLLGCAGALVLVLTLARSSWREKALGLLLPRTVRPGFATDYTLDIPGITQPPTLPNGKAGLDDNATVIGVSAGGRHRAYSMAAVGGGPSSDIVNDLLGDVPIAVTRCDLSRCTRVFTGELGKLLDLSVGGRKAYKLVLKVGNHRYMQDSTVPLDAGAPAFPYPKHPWELTTWGQWRRDHPSTDVYVGASLPGS